MERINKKVEYVKSLQKVQIEEGDLVGARGVQTALLVQKHVPIPGGFILTSNAFFEILDQSQTTELIQSLVSKLSTNNEVSFTKASKQIQKRILAAKIPEDIKADISKAYSNLSGFTDTYVSVKSSSTVSIPDSSSYQGAELHDYVNIKGIDELINSIKFCWAHQFDPVFIEYLFKERIPPDQAGMSIMVQKMIQAESSGVLYTGEVSDIQEDVVQIEAILGLVTPLLENEIVPDYYVVAKKNNEVIKKHIVVQDWMLVRQGKKDRKGDERTSHVDISAKWRKQQKIDDSHIEKLAKVGTDIESILKESVDVEWAYESGKIWITEVKNPYLLPLHGHMVDDNTDVDNEITYEETMPLQDKEQAMSSQDISEESLNLRDLQLLLYGEPGNGGVSTGMAYVLRNNKVDISDVDGKIIVTSKLLTVDLQKLKNAAGVVLDYGTSDSEVILIARQLGLPTIINTQIASKIIADGEVISMSGETGEIYEGSLSQEPSNETDSLPKIITTIETPAEKVEIKTATKVFANISYYDELKTYNNIPLDGIIPFTPNAVIGEVGIHPEKALLSKRDSEEFTRSLYFVIADLAEKISPLPLVYQLSDLTAQEMRELSGGVDYEPQDPNIQISPTQRFIDKPEILRLEVDAIKRVRNKLSLRNVWFAVGGIQSSSQLSQIKKALSALGIRRSSTMKLYVILSTPGNIVDVESLISTGIDGLIIDVGKIESLMYGTEAGVLDEKKDPNVENIKWILENIHAQATSNKVPVVLKGVFNPDSSVVSTVIQYGVSGFSATESNIVELKEVIKKQEHSLLVKKGKKTDKKKKLRIRKKN